MSLQVNIIKKKKHKLYNCHEYLIFSADKKRYRKAKEFRVVMGTLNRFERVNGTIVSDVSSIAYMKTFSLDTMRDDVGKFCK